MNRKEINIFSTSFLDLLSGALGAVLILFIIIPKMTSEQQNALEEIERLNVQAEQLAELIEQARNSIPAELFEQIQEEMEAMQNRLQELRQSVENLQQRLQNCEEENSRLRQQMDEMRRQMDEMRQQVEQQGGQVERQRQELEQTRRELQETRRQLDEATARLRQRDGLPSSFVDKGDVQVFILWEENVDVDLYVQNLGNGEICGHPGSSYENARSWGMLTEDINHLRLRGDGVKYYEIFYQPRPVPGRYKIWFQIFQSEDGTHWNGRPAMVSGFIILFSGTPNEKRIDFPTVTLTRALENHIVGTLTVTVNNIILER